SPATRPGIFGRLIRKRNTDAVGLCQSEEEKNYTKEVKGLVVKSKKVRSKVPKLSNYYYLDEMIKQRLVVFENTIHAMDDILKVMERCSVKFSDPARKDD
uniref:Uncharacterized protein n=1 Tax=Wuchereria bancrofti TaxID=6293 RepID=A0A1I8EBS7_WUCBA